MKQNHNRIFIIVSLSLFNTFISTAQIKKENLKLGFVHGYGTENTFPFNKKDYDHTVTLYKVQINYLIKEKRKWSYEINIEPSYNIAEHQLLNKWFIKQSSGEDYLERRELFTQKRKIKEYTLNFGFLTRYTIFKKWSVYNLASIGPMISNKNTERLAKGFAFSDILAFGTSYKIDEIQLDFRYSIRHTSNFNFKSPNNGHNTANIEFGVLFKL
jgi:Lipid A 3-O-deacylase (PagL)